MDCHARQAASTAHAHAAGQQAAQPALDAAAAVGQEAAPSCCAPVIAFFEPPALLAPRAPQTAWPLSAFSRKPSFLTDGIYRPPRKRA
ncbi:MAG: hypothetical protein LBP52_02310 [Burkholderiaceae bacterium]|nr:hypothetical protein [Burkholderiaceae bacterium]